MPLPDDNYSTLANIRTKVRRLTRSPSVSQITDPNIDNYINTFVLYDFPEQLRTFALRKTLTFYTQPYVDTYSTVAAPSGDALYNFKNKYSSVHPPIYIAGYSAFFSQSREQFFGIYPKITSMVQVATGDNILTNFTGTLTGVPVLPNEVLFTSIDQFNNGLGLKDNGLGDIVNLDGTATVPASTIDYVTGVYDINFSSAPDVDTPIYSQTVPYVAARPLAVLYYGNEFTLRPVPNSVYAVSMEVFIRPTELLNGTDIPELARWWQYIAYGASKKIFEDRMDQESVMAIMPEFKSQERIALRSTLVQYSNERTATIYTEQTAGPTNSGWGWGSGGLF
jgi:hypothetical protein